MAEAVMSVSLREIAKKKNLDLFENVYMQFIDDLGSSKGGAQSELDAIMLGTNKIEEVVSVKANIDAFRMSGKDKKRLKEYFDMPTETKALRKHLRERFGAAGNDKVDYSNVTSVLVKYNGGSITLKEFKKRYLDQLKSVEEVKIVPATPSPHDDSKGGYVHRFDNKVFIKETAKLVALKLGVTITI